MALKPGDVVTADCQQVDRLPPRALALAGDGTLAEAGNSGVMARGRLLLASRHDDYVSALSDNGLAVCEDFHPFAAAGAPLRLALELGGPPVPRIALVHILQELNLPGLVLVDGSIRQGWYLSFPSFVTAGNLLLVAVALGDETFEPPGAYVSDDVLRMSDSLGNTYHLLGHVFDRGLDLGGFGPDNHFFVWWAVAASDGPCEVQVHWSAMTGDSPFYATVSLLEFSGTGATQPDAAATANNTAADRTAGDASLTLPLAVSAPHGLAVYLVTPVALSDRHLDSSGFLTTAAPGWTQLTACRVVPFFSEFPFGPGTFIAINTDVSAAQVASADYRIPWQGLAVGGTFLAK